jgi:hypothetical protein
VIETKVTCDRCGLSIEPLDDAFFARNIAGGGSLVTLQRTNGGMGHNGIPPAGWHFHYLCFSVVVDAITKTLTQAQNKEKR